MERIRQAIELAKQQRRGAIGTRSFSACRPNVEEPRPVKDGKVNYRSSRCIKFTDDELKSRLIIGGMAHDRRSIPYRNLRSHVLKIMRQHHWKTLAITSPTVGNGKTLTAINLAICISQELNQTVLLADLDLRNPAVARTFGIEDIESGIVEAAFGETSLGNTLINPGYERLIIAPAKNQGYQTSEILSSPNMLAMQEEIRERYPDRLIIYDIPALLSSDDALVITQNVDAVLLIVEDGGATKDQLKHSMRLLEHTNILGVVVNKLGKT